MSPEAIDINPRWLSITHACKYASLSDKTLMKHIAKREIYGTKKGGKWLVDRLSIDEFMLRDRKEVADIVARVMRRTA